MKTDNDSRDRWLQGLDTYIEVLEDAEEEQESKPKPKTDYRKKIAMRAKAIKQAQGEWKLRPKPDTSSGQQTPKPATTPKTKLPSQPKQKAHGDAPQAPAGQEYYWYDYKPTGKGA